MTCLRDLMPDIAAAYHATPSTPADPWTRMEWAALASACRSDFAAIVTSRLSWFHVTDEPEPYATAEAMRRHVARGYFAVSRANCEHPVWSAADNVAFRTAHDILGHCDADSGFDWIGELAACAYHGSGLMPGARPALFVECIMQTGTAIHDGRFPAQKVGDPRPYMSPALADAYAQWLSDPFTY